MPSDPVPAFVNPSAGNAKAAFEALRGDSRVRLHETSAADLENTIAGVLDEGAATIIVAGGDGTVSTAAAHMVDSPASLCVLRAGTLNHFARRLGVPADPQEALELAFTGATKKVDVGWMNDRLFLNTSVVGLYVDYVRLRERLEKRLGRLPASVGAAVRSLFTLHDQHVELELEGTLRSYESGLFFVGVGEREFQVPVLGELKPAGRRGLHVVVMEPESRGRLLVAIVRLAARGIRVWPTGNHPDSFVVDAYRLYMRHPAVLVALDGEIVKVPTPLSYRFQKDALAVRTPSET